MKLTKMYYYKANGEKSVNCYRITIPKAIIKAAGISDKDFLSLNVNDNKIEIKKVGE